MSSLIRLVFLYPWFGIKLGTAGFSGWLPANLSYLSAILNCLYPCYNILPSPLLCLWCVFSTFLPQNTSHTLWISIWIKHKPMCVCVSQLYDVLQTLWLTFSDFGFLWDDSRCHFSEVYSDYWHEFALNTLEKEFNYYKCTNGFHSISMVAFAVILCVLHLKLVSEVEVNMLNNVKLAIAARCQSLCYCHLNR